MFQLVLDFPRPGTTTDAVHIAVQGWIAAEASAKFGDVTLIGKGIRVPMRLVERPDVAKAVPEAATTGFAGSLSAQDVETPNQLSLRIEIDGNSRVIPLDVMVLPNPKFKKDKATKLANIARILQCPLCGDRNLRLTDTVIRCAADHRFEYGLLNYNFLDDSLKLGSGVVHTDNVSAHGYDPVALELIDRFRDGLILDAGSGLRDTYLPNVVNMEIVEYASTDVVGVCEHMPFADNSFDAVLSLAVLEHLRNPFEAAREIVRVLKPGGVLYAAVPFLQPFHGYPNHYYNMTSSGLRNLFGDLDIQEVSVPKSGLPIFALTWILTSWHRGLPDETARRFKNMTVGELMGDPLMYLNEHFVTELSHEATEYLACLNTLIAAKPFG